LPIANGMSASGAIAVDQAQQSIETLKAILDYVTDLILVCDLDGKVLHASASWVPALGFSSSDLLGRSALSLLHPDDISSVRQSVATGLKEGPPAAIEARYLHRDGSWRRAASRNILLRSQSGGGEGMAIVARLIDDPVLAERKFQAVHAETELFLESIPSILIGLNSEGRITRWNPTATQVLGLESAEVRGRRIDDCGIKSLSPEMKSEVRQWLHAETLHRSDNIPYEKDGKTRFLGLNVRRIPSLIGERDSFIVTGADVTERKSLEEQLRQSQKLEAIGQLAAGIAHEINTPTQYVGDNTTFLKESWQSVSAILELAQTIRRAATGRVDEEILHQFDRQAQDADLEYLLREIPRAIDQSLEGLQRVAKIVRGMKEFSHPGSEEKRAIDINKAIETTVTVARHEWKYVADVDLQLDRHLPPVPCLAGEFNQVILNLIINAAQAIAEVVPEGSGEKGTISISTRQDGDWVEIALHDTGGGIPAEISSRIFEPFFTTKAVGKGTGQGLALAHAVIVKRHQGQIWFNSKVGQGTTFFIRLPIETGVPVTT